MTPKEAIENIKLARAEVEWNYPIDYYLAFNKAIEALEKDIAKEPMYIFDDNTYLCDCGYSEQFNKILYCHCPQCGQLLYHKN